MKKKGIESNNLDNSNKVNSNTANAVMEKVDNLNSVISKEKLEEINIDNLNELNTAVLSPSDPLNEESVISTKKMSENSLKQAKTKELEIINKTDNSNEGINSTIAEGDNSTANAVQEFRDKCTNYTIILEGKKIEIDRTIDEFVREYYSEIMNNILTTKEFEKQRKIFNRMIVDNNLNDIKYNEMCDKLDVRYSRYVQLDKQQANKQTEKEEFSNEEIQYIANELLQQCLNFRLTSENNMQDFYDLRNNYNAFIEQYNVPKEGLKLQKKFAELSFANKALNSPVKSQSFAN